MALMTRSAAVVIAAVIALSVPGCLFVKAPPDQSPEVQNVALSPQPEVPMSDEIIRTRAGDMIAFLPQGWVFLDTKDRQSADVVAVAVNPDYTLSAVFSTIADAESSREARETEGVLGLARIAFSRHARKTAGATKLVGTYGTAELGPRRFGTYAFSTTGGAQRTRCAVFTASTGTQYEFALVPLAVSGRDIPPDADIQSIFRSILSTVQY